MQRSPFRSLGIENARLINGCVLALMLAVVAAIVVGCASTVDKRSYPRLQPIDALLAEAEVSGTDPGPAQVQRAANLRNRVARIAP